MTMQNAPGPGAVGGADGNNGTAIAGVVLAGGLARRMGGGDKVLQNLGGRRLLDHILDRTRPQVTALCLNANGDPARFAAFDVPVVADPLPGFAGPLAGILAGLDWAAGAVPGCSWLASFPGDAPFLPRDLVARMNAELITQRADMACAASRGRAHPVIGLWPLALRANLRQALIGQGLRKVDHWTGRFNLVQVDFAAEGGDPFFNANRPEDLALAESLLVNQD